MLNDYLLEDQEVIDEESELLKLRRKNKIDAFADGHEEMLLDNGHCKDKVKIDGSMKAHFVVFSCTLMFNLGL